MSKKVSIIIPVYNGSNYLKQAIDSALAQVYDNFEVIVVNDGSNDDLRTERIALSYGNKILYHYQENKGVASAWNKGIALSSGDYISFLSHDDIYTKDKISVQVKMLQKQTKQSIAYSNWIIIDEKSIEKNRIKLPNIDITKFFLYYLLNQSLHGCSLLIPKSVFQTEGLFDESLKSTCDYDFILKVATKINFVLCSEFLVLSRKHSDQYTYKILTHETEKQKLFIKYTQNINKDLLNKAFNDQDIQKYLFNLFVKFLNANYQSAILYLFKQIFEIFNGNSNLIKEIIFEYMKVLSNSIK
jgi:glycosyltransferase involved in cell wall biosynthesis